MPMISSESLVPMRLQVVGSKNVRGRREISCTAGVMLEKKQKTSTATAHGRFLFRSLLINSKCLQKKENCLWLIMPSREGWMQNRDKAALEELCCGCFFFFNLFWVMLHILQQHEKSWKMSSTTFETSCKMKIQWKKWLSEGRGGFPAHRLEEKEEQ